MNGNEEKKAPKMVQNVVQAETIYDEYEKHENCVVEIWRNSKTGEVSVGWYENE